MKNLFTKFIITSLFNCLIIDQAYAINLKLYIDNSIRQPKNELLIKYKVITCPGNKTSCPHQERSIEFNSFPIPSNKMELATKTLKKDFSHYGLPIKSSIEGDSFLSFDVTKDGKSLNLPNCHIILNGISDINIQLSSIGCIIN